MKIMKGMKAGWVLCCFVIATDVGPAAGLQIELAGRTTMPVGTGIITGTVLTDAGVPASGAEVRLAWHQDPTGASAWDNYPERTATADAVGHFEFTKVAQHSVDLSASLSEWARVEYGQVGLGLPGVPIRLLDAERLSVTIKLARAVSLAGTIRENDGGPAAEVEVYASRMRPVGVSTLLVGEGGKAITNADGNYVISGLLPGRFLVSAYRPQPHYAPPPLINVGPDRLAVASARFFRDASDEDSAELIDLKAGEQRTGVDVRLRLTPVTTIRGSVRDSEDKPAAGVPIWMTGDGGPFQEMTKTSGDGTFEITRIAKGRYDLVGILGEEVTHASFESDGESPIRLEPHLRLEPGAIVHGRIVMADAKSPVPKSPWVFLNAVSGIMHFDSPAGSGQHASPEFAYRGVPPGTYVVEVPDAPRMGLKMKSETVDGLDAMDFPFTVTAGSVHDVVITLTDQLATLSGAVTDSIGRPSLGHTVVIFATDSRFWGDRSRRVFADRPDTHGQYLVRDLVAGEYAVALAPPDLYGEPRPALLRELLPSSRRITIRDGEPAVCDVRVQSSNSK